MYRSKRIMDASNRSGRQKILTLFGSMVLYMPGNVDWLWGDISVYVFSFVLSRQPSNTSVEIPWMISLFSIFWIAALTLEGIVSKFVKRRWLVLMTIVFQDLSFFMCHFAVQNSLATLTLTFGVLMGITQGLLFGNSIHAVISTANNDEGFLSAMLLSVTSFGGLISSQVSTWYVNPQNESPNWVLGSTKYFTQRHIIDKVPSMFLVIGCLSLFLHSMALILLQANSDMRFITSACSRKSEQLIPIKENVCQMKNEIPTEFNEESQVENSYHRLYSNNKAGDYTPKEMLKTVTFYVLWISIFTCEFPSILLLNYYKVYGQIWIRDDHFLTYLGTTYMLLISVSKIPWGMAVDKFNCQHCLVGLISVVILIQSWFYFTAMVGRWMYFFTTCVYGNFSGASYSFFTATAAMLFGKQHVSTNSGLLLTSALAANICAPPLIDVILTKFGWFTVFAGAGGLNTISLCLLLCHRFV